MFDLHERIVADSEAGQAGGAKLLQLNRLIADCLGLYVETTVPQAEIVPGETLNLRCTAVVRSVVPVRWESVQSLPDDWRMNDQAAVDLHDNQVAVRDAALSVPATIPFTQPYWLREEGTPGMYKVDNMALIGLPAQNPPLVTLYTFSVSGQRFGILDEAMQVTADPSKGEVRRALDIVPTVALRPSRDVELFTPNSRHTVEIEIRATRGDQHGTLALNAPSDWQVTPASQEFHLDAANDHVRFSFTVTAPAQTTTAFLTAQAAIGGHVYNTSRQEIRYEHIPRQLLQPLARIKAVCLDLAIRGEKIGYLPGAGDRTSESLAAMGYTVTPLAGADLTADRLRAFDAVIIGVRAFNVRSDLAPGLPALFAYAESGGNVVVQYNTPNDLRNPRLAPFDLELSRDLPHNRVTNEKAPVAFLLPDHPVFNAPNRITPADFEGWIQERGLNFPSKWDHDHFAALLACSDPGEPPLEGGLLVADYGKGHFTYTGLSFFRQLPAGVPGAYRLFANLVSLGR